MTIQERAEKAVELRMRGGYNCSQAVTAVLADQTELSEEHLRQISAGFCAGMGNMEATCGALIGAGIVAGLKTGGVRTLQSTRSMIQAFQDRCGEVKCADLKSKVDGKVLCPCEDCVRNAVLIYGETIGLE